MLALIEKMKDRWSSQGMLIPPGVSEERLVAFESRYSVRLPRDVREFLEAVDGPGQYLCDEQFFALWPLDEFRTIRVEWPEATALPDPDSYVVFSDHSIHCPTYAIRMGRDPDGPNPILAIFSDNMRFEAYPLTHSRAEVPMISFTEFLEELLATGFVM